MKYHNYYIHKAYFDFKHLQNYWFTSTFKKKCKMQFDICKMQNIDNIVVKID